MCSYLNQHKFQREANELGKIIFIFLPRLKYFNQNSHKFSRKENNYKYIGNKLKCNIFSIVEMWMFVFSLILIVSIYSYKEKNTLQKLQSVTLYFVCLLKPVYLFIWSRQNGVDVFLKIYFMWTKNILAFIWTSLMLL